MWGFEDMEYELYVDQFSIEDTRKDLQRIVDYFKQVDYWEIAMKAFFVDYRELPMEAAIMTDAFAVDENTTKALLPDWMDTEPLGFIKKGYIPMAGRCVFPVKDVRGQVMGFCGWDPFDKPKYLDSKNYGYKAKATTLFGMEKLPEYYTAKGPVFLTEGLMCMIYLRLNGFMALSSLGSYLTPYLIVILNRFGDRLVAVPDNDETGDKFAHQIKRDVPKARMVQVAFGKDIEGCRKFEEHRYEEQLLKELSLMDNPFARTELLIRR